MVKAPDEGVFELHYQVREYGHFTWQLYRREENGQLRLVDSEDFGPFDSMTHLRAWLGMRIWKDLGLPFG